MTPAMAMRRFCPPESSSGDFSNRSSESRRSAPPRGPARPPRSRELHVLGAEGDIPVYRLLKELVLRVLEHEAPPLKRTSRAWPPSLRRCPRPRRKTLPEEGFSSPFRCWMKVLLPEPVWPMTTTSWPSYISTSMSYGRFFKGGAFAVNVAQPHGSYDRAHTH